jgi:hypothetical protein
MMARERVVYRNGYLVDIHNLGTVKHFLVCGPVYYCIFLNWMDADF